MPHRADILTGLPRQMALALAIMGMLAGAAPAAAQQTAAPSPQELWRTYPLDHGKTPRVRLPPGSEVRTTPAAPRPAAAAGRGSNGGGATLPVAIAVGLAALLCGLLLGRRRRRSPSAGAPPPEHEQLRAAPALPAEPEPEPARVPPPATAEIPAPVPPPRREPEDRAPQPPPVAAPPDPEPQLLRAAPELSPLDLEVERLRTGRFERRPWPPETEGAWRCEIGWHAGTLSSAFRAMAWAPGRRRPKEVGRSEPQRLWGAAPPEPPTAELVTAADRLAAALLDAGWEPVEGGGDAWYATRFSWPHAEPPPRGLRVRRPTSESQEEVPRGA